MNVVLRNELRRNTNRVTITIFLLFIMIGILIHQAGIERYKNAVAQKTYFLEIEKKRVSQYRNYSEYGVLGFKILSEPGKLYSLFFNSSTCGDLIGYITNSEKLELTKPQIGHNLFDKPTGGVLDFSWYILLIGCVICLFYGLETYRNEGYIKLMLTVAKPATVYFSVSIGRILLLIASLSFIILVAFFQFLFNGLLSVQVIKGLLAFLFNSLIYIVPLFIFSSLMGYIKNRLLSFGLTIFILFGLVFIWPEILTSFVSQNAIKNVKPFYKHEIMKKNVFMNFEKRFIEQIRKSAPEERLQVSKNMIEDFFNNDFKQIKKLEFEMMDKTEKLAKKFHFWSVFNPVTFYKSVNNEISSRGYMAYLSFYRDLHEKQKQFLRFYFDKRFNGNNTGVEPFLKDDGYIFKLRPSLPHYFLLGVIVQLCYIIILFTFGYCRFKKIFFPKEKADSFSNLNFDFVKGKHYVYNYSKNDLNFPSQIFNVLMGKPGNFSGKMSIAGKSIVTGQRQSFLYFPFPDALPGKLSVNAVINLIACLYRIPKPDIEKVKCEYKEKVKGENKKKLNTAFEKLESIEKVNLMLKMAEYLKAEIYLFNNFLVNIESKHLPVIIDKIKAANILIFEVDSIHVEYGKFDHLYVIRYDMNSKYEEMQIE